MEFACPAFICMFNCKFHYNEINDTSYVTAVKPQHRILQYRKLEENHKDKDIH